MSCKELPAGEVGTEHAEHQQANKPRCQATNTPKISSSKLGREPCFLSLLEMETGQYILLRYHTQQKYGFNLQNGHVT